MGRDPSGIVVAACAPETGVLNLRHPKRIVIGDVVRPACVSAASSSSDREETYEEG